jgi:hypothetical protein
LPQLAERNLDNRREVAFLNRLSAQEKPADKWPVTNNTLTERATKGRTIINQQPINNTRSQYHNIAHPCRSDYADAAPI